MVLCGGAVALAGPARAHRQKPPGACRRASAGDLVLQCFHCLAQYVWAREIISISMRRPPEEQFSCRMSGNRARMSSRNWCIPVMCLASAMPTRLCRNRNASRAGAFDTGEIAGYFGVQGKDRSTNNVAFAPQKATTQRSCSGTGTNRVRCHDGGCRANQIGVFCCISRDRQATQRSEGWP